MCKVLGILFFCFLGGGFWSGQTCASTNSAKALAEGHRLYGEGKYAEAVAAFEKATEADAQGYLARYNLGTALVKAGDFERAVETLRQALLTDDPELRAKAQFNLGNALYRYGISKEDADIDAAIRHLEEALGHYDRVDPSKAATEVPEDSDLTHNRAFVEAELERLRQKKEQAEQQGESGETQKSPESQDSKDENPEKNQDQQQNSDEQKQSGGGQGQGSPEEQPNQPPETKDEGRGTRDEQQGSGNQGQPSPGEHPQPPPPQEDGDGEASGEPQNSGQSSGGSSQPQDAPAKPKPRKAQGAPSEDARDKALRMLENYKNTEEPQGVMMFIPRGNSDDPVEQDW